MNLRIIAALLENESVVLAYVEQHIATQRCLRGIVAATTFSTCTLSLPENAIQAKRRR